jgi:hypothetical protein
MPQTFDELLTSGIEMLPKPFDPKAAALMTTV